MIAHLIRVPRYTVSMAWSHQGHATVPELSSTIMQRNKASLTFQHQHECSEKLYV